MCCQAWLPTTLARLIRLLLRCCARPSQRPSSTLLSRLPAWLQLLNLLHFPLQVVITGSFPPPLQPRLMLPTAAGRLHAATLAPAALVVPTLRQRHVLSYAALGTFVPTGTVLTLLVGGLGAAAPLLRAIGLAMVPQESTLRNGSAVARPSVAAMLSLHTLQA